MLRARTSRYGSLERCKSVGPIEAGKCIAEGNSRVFGEVELNDYRFDRVTVADLPMIDRWLQTPAVREWWIDAEGNPADPIGASDLGQRDVDMWIVSWKGLPFAFMQDYDPHACEGHHFAYLPAGSRGIDQFIGDAAMLDRGHGSSFIKARIATLFASGVPAVGTDPHPRNARAIRAYEKSGFVAKEICSTAWGMCLLMEVQAGRS
ncbi:aminoglycoside 6'-N-acetyltransferase [Allosphingosinicella indica]|uniref:Aminoglycoside 6'-N-acetyltransferase n=1 Tax=Allosphingosinicella indica TaxID=941907 RepID=A0A1X7FYJ0_9SPHN|nr:aminoglycoside 6'-N-acetyltransferase [Allosphingosinicella indica]